MEGLHESIIGGNFMDAEPGLGERPRSAGRRSWTGSNFYAFDINVLIALREQKGYQTCE